MTDTDKKQETDTDRLERLLNVMLQSLRDGDGKAAIMAGEEAVKEANKLPKQEIVRS